MKSGPSISITDQFSAVMVRKLVIRQILDSQYIAQHFLELQFGRSIHLTQHRTEASLVSGLPARSLRAHVDACLGRIDEARAMLAEAMTLARAGDETAHLFNANVVLLEFLQLCSPSNALTVRRDEVVENSFVLALLDH